MDYVSLNELFNLSCKRFNRDQSFLRRLRNIEPGRKKTLRIGGRVYQIHRKK